MKRMEIIFSQSIDDDFIQKCAEKDVGKYYTKIPVVFGQGFSEPKMGDSIWPQSNTMYIIFCSEDEEQIILTILEDLRKEYIGEGIACFVSDAEVR